MVTGAVSGAGFQLARKKFEIIFTSVALSCNEPTVQVGKASKMAQLYMTWVVNTRMADQA